MEKLAIKLYLDKDLAAWVKEQARLRRCSMAQVYRDLIVKAMEESSGEHHKGESGLGRSSQTR